MIKDLENKDYLIKAINKEGSIRVYIARTTNIVEEARERHNTSPTASAALGRTLTAGSLMASMMKNEEDLLTLKISGDGPAGNILVVADSKGRVKGYIDRPDIDIESNPDGSLNVRGIVGTGGYITVSMDLGLREPYVGQAPIVSGEIAEDIANYYAYSQQQPSAVALGVLVDKDISIRASGGFIIQVLPGVKEEEIDLLEKSLAQAPAMSSMIDKGMSPEEILEEILKGFDMEVLEYMELSFECDCNREKIEKVLKSLGKLQLEEILEEDGQAEVVCHFCNKKYFFDDKDLEVLIKEIE